MPNFMTNYYFHDGQNNWTGALNYTPIPEFTASVSVSTDKKKEGISPELYFKYVKKKFNVLEKINLNGRLKTIEKAFDEAVKNGQEMLGEKILRQLEITIRESIIASKGIINYIEREDLYKHKHQIREGHISDTLLKNYTKIIPKGIANKIKKLKDIFDDFVIWHYYCDEAEKKIEKKQKVTAEEKNAMRDPILFGIIKETDRLYLIDDWIDKWCDLTFDEIINVIGSKVISKKVNFIKS